MQDHEPAGGPYDERLAASLARVRERMEAAAVRGGRSQRVQLIAVTKGHPAAAAEAAWRAGLTALGENRVQELEEKRGAFRDLDPSPEWHLIGHLQRNKVKRAVPLFDCIHSVDSLRLAQELSRHAEAAGAGIRALVQVNVSGEETKGGFDAARAVAGINDVASLPGLNCTGLMTMAPFTDDEAVVRSTFVKTRELLERCAAEDVPLQGSELSMGMSGDFEIAIEEGSTMVRLGTILFGERVT